MTGRDPDHDPEEEPDPAGGRLEAFLRPLVTDSTLWPVLLVVLAVFATFFAGAILAALRARSLFAVAALLGLAWLTTGPVMRDLRARRLSAGSAILLLLWLLAVAVALVGARTGFL